MLLTLALLLCLLSGTGICADAPVVVCSLQHLSVDGECRDVEMYNIDGSNYLMLRDLACLLNGTPAQFSVDWDEPSQTVRIVTGAPYAPNGSELRIGEDRSDTALRGTHALVINGAAFDGLAAFNLADNNFFRIRDLGEALGFGVDEFLSEPGAFSLVEWPERIKGLLPDTTIRVELTHRSENEREIRIILP